MTTLITIVTVLAAVAGFLWLASWLALYFVIYLIKSFVETFK